MNLLGIRINSLSREDLEKTMAEKLEGDKFFHIVTVNPEMLVTAQKNNEFKNILNTSDLNVCDGFGITLWAKLLYGQKINRIPGVEVAETLCRICAQKRKSIYFLGGFGGFAEKSAEFLKKKYPNIQIIGIDSEGFWNDPVVTEKVKEKKPTAVLVAFGAPKQELWLKNNGTKIPFLRIGIGVGGTFDFWGGKIKRAPLLFQKIGLEWLYRLFQEPSTRIKRIWKAVGVFSWLVVKEKIFTKN